ncbi:MAG: hypothetical protein IJI14_15310 [Anaerolineaceae bacterium]|nr:hypothetical protein [Anaerolineaceae bacterium]
MKSRYNYYLVESAAESCKFVTRREAENYIGAVDEKIMKGILSPDEVKYIHLFDKDGDLVVDCSYA